LWVKLSLTKERKSGEGKHKRDLPTLCVKLSMTKERKSVEGNIKKIYLYSVGKDEPVDKTSNV